MSRYYNPEWGRFVNADEPSLLEVAALMGNSIDLNLFAYCCNNPVNYADPVGKSIVVALIIAIVAGAVISGGINLASQAIAGKGINWRSVGASALAGGVVGGLMAVPGAQGVALTLGQTMVWGGLASGLGYGVYNLANGTKTTLTGYAFAMAFGAVFSGISFKFTSGRVTVYKSRGSTGRTIANNLKEQLAMKQVVSNPLSGAKKLTNIVMNDKRWPASDNVNDLSVRG